MTFLPIAQRELMVASRRRSTFRVRLVAALIAIIVSFFLMVFAGLFGGARQLGENLFSFLSVSALLFCLFAGVFLTADALSEERREGTLGFLFLTDLGGFDIVTGKLLIAGLNAFYGVVAILPVMAIAWLMGGVTGGEFWRMALVLLNTLFVSLALGLWVSAAQRQQSEALARTFIGIIAVTVLPSIAGWASGAANLPQFEWVRGFSPWWPLHDSHDAMYQLHPGRYWQSLALTHLLAWLFLLRASFVLPRRWREGEAPQSRVPGASQKPNEPASAVARKRRRVRPDLLELNPVLALAMPGPGVRWLAWAALLVGLPLLFVFLRSGPGISGAFSIVFTNPLLLAPVPLEILFAWQASMFFIEARRTGALELLLSTPLTDYEIIQGQILALRRTFGGPVTVIAVLALVGPIVGIVIAMATAGFGPSGPPWPTLLFVLAFGCWTVATMLLTFWALAWMGLWLALSDQRPGLVFAKSVGFVSILPLIIPCLPKLLFSLLFLGHARNKFRMSISSILQGQRKPWRP